jgi:hypothetical protein
MSNPIEPPSQAMTALIDELVKDLRPVRVVSLAAASFAALGLQFFFVAGAAMLMGINGPTVARLFQGPMAVIFLMLVACSLLCGLVAVRLAIPGRHVSRVVTSALVAAPILIAIGCLGWAPSGADWGHFASHLGSGFACFAETLALALPAWFMSLLLLRRLAPLAPIFVGFFGGLTALFQGALIIQLVCPSGEAYHLALGHYMPLVVMASLAALASGFLLRLALGAGELPRAD